MTPDLDSTAAEWVSLIATDPAPENIAAARQWCDRSEQHRAAFEQARWLFTASGKLKPRAASSRTASPRWPLTTQLAVAATVIIAAAVAWLSVPTGDYHSDATIVRDISLADGSVMTLDVDSAVDVHYTAERRELHLLKGAAFFEVAPDVRRPFVVHGLEVTATAVGTAYAVRRDGGSVVVTVEHGIVRVDCSNDGQPFELRKGNAVRCGLPARRPTVERVKPEVLLAWTQGRLRFEMTPLRDVVAEINRYRPGYIVITDPKLDELRVSGVFRTDRLDDALIMLEQALQIRVHKMTDYLVLLD